jgi:hypothetical protein
MIARAESRIYIGEQNAVIGVIDYNFAAHTGVLRVMRSA